MTKEEEKIIICFFIIFWLIGLGVGVLWGRREIVNKLNNVDKVHFEMAQKDYKYCPYCGEYIKSEDVK